MTPFLPTAAEEAGLRFLLPLGDLRFRLALAGGFFAVGLAAWSLGPWPLAAAGLPLLLAGRLALWARSQTTTPGGATPAHEDVWAPVENEWLERVSDLEKRGARWDTTPWDVSNGRGCLALLGVLLLVAVLALLTSGSARPSR